MKHTHTLILVALIGLSTTAAVPPDCRGTVVFEDDFESYEVGGEPTPTWRSFNDGPEATSIVVALALYAFFRFTRIGLAMPQTLCQNGGLTIGTETMPHL